MISLRLYLEGAELDPFDITKRLGVVPTRSHAKGDFQRRANGDLIARTIGLWVCKFEAESAEFGVPESFLALRDLLGSKIELLHLLPHVEAAWLDLHIVQEDDGESRSASLALTPSDLQIVTAFALPLEITISRVPEPMEPVAVTKP